MAVDEWQKKINDENRLREEEEYKRYSSMEKTEPLTEQEFEGILEQSDERYNKALEENKASYCSACDFYWADINDAARSVNPGEWYRAWHCHYPRLIDKWGHSIEWMRQADYYVNKALACGYAKTAEEAVDWFMENK